MYKGTLIAVRDMEISKRFYCGLLGMKVTADFGANVGLEGGLFLQTLATWESLIEPKEVSLGNHAAELYFEVPDIDRFSSALQAEDIEYVHGLIEHRWGQRAVRFYDPDHHVIEVAEELTAVAVRFLQSGMMPEQVAERMDVPLAYVLKCCKP